MAPADFTKVGVRVSSLKEANLDNDASAYCVYGATDGKVEFDIFYPAGDSPENVKATEKNDPR